MILGVDPGKDGASTLLTTTGKIIRSEGMWENKVTKFLDVKALWSFLKEYRYIIQICYLEKVHSIGGAGAKSNFSFGGVFYVTWTFLIILEIPHVLVPPKTWQKEMFQGIEKQVFPDRIITKGKNKGKLVKGGKTDTKKMALMACNKLYPDANLLKTKRSSVPHDGIIDSILIAEYGRRQVCR